MTAPRKESRGRQMRALLVTLSLPWPFFCLMIAPSLVVLCRVVSCAPETTGASSEENRGGLGNIRNEECAQFARRVSSSPRLASPRQVDILFTGRKEMNGPEEEEEDLHDNSLPPGGSPFFPYSEQAWHHLPSLTLSSLSTISLRMTPVEQAP